VNLSYLTITTNATLLTCKWIVNIFVKYIHCCFSFLLLSILINLFMHTKRQPSRNRGSSQYAGDTQSTVQSQSGRGTHPPYVYKAYLSCRVRSENFNNFRHFTVVRLARRWSHHRRLSQRPRNSLTSIAIHQHVQMHCTLNQRPTRLQPSAARTFACCPIAIAVEKTFQVKLNHSMMLLLVALEVYAQFYIETIMKWR